MRCCAWRCDAGHFERAMFRSQRKYEEGQTRNENDRGGRGIICYWCIIVGWHPHVRDLHRRALYEEGTVKDQRSKVLSDLPIRLSRRLENDDGVG